MGAGIGRRKTRAPKTSWRYWADRLFRNSYTRGGERRWVEGWCVKIQHGGLRRTLRLRSAGRRAAAEEAAALYRNLARHGWAAVEAALLAGLDPAEAGGGAAAKAQVLRVGLRKYMSDLDPALGREHFAELSLNGRVEHVRLGAEDLNTARLRAKELQAELQRHGWERLTQTRAREVTIAIFWRANPMTCTYTTLLTVPAANGLGVGRAPRERGWRILLIEADGGVRRAMQHWLLRATGVRWVVGVSDASAIPPGLRADLLIANRHQATAAVRAAAPLQLTHGIFADSDAIFASFSGVSEGYLLRRVRPAELLAPLLQSFSEGPPARMEDTDRPIRRYFQAIFEPPISSRAAPAPDLTAREFEILELLRRGLADKEVGRELGISVWTVHSHVKRIFAKFGVRTRTEAVVRHLQK